MRLGSGRPGQVGYLNWKTCLVDFRDGSIQTHLLPQHRQSSATLTQLLLPSCSNIGLSISLVTSRSKAVLPKVQSPDQQHYHPLGTCQRCPFLGLIPDLMTQKLWEDGLGVCVFSKPFRGSYALSYKNLWSGKQGDLGSFHLCVTGFKPNRLWPGKAKGRDTPS